MKQLSSNEIQHKVATVRGEGASEYVPYIEHDGKKYFQRDESGEYKRYPFYGQADVAGKEAAKKISQETGMSVREREPYYDDSNDYQISMSPAPRRVSRAENKTESGCLSIIAALFVIAVIIGAVASVL